MANTPTERRGYSLGDVAGTRKRLDRQDGENYFLRMRFDEPFAAR